MVGIAKLEVGVDALASSTMMSEKVKGVTTRCSELCAIHSVNIGSMSKTSNRINLETCNLRCNLAPQFKYSHPKPCNTEEKREDLHLIEIRFHTNINIFKFSFNYK